jgi:cell division protein FtsL
MNNFTISGVPVILIIVPIVAGIGIFVFKKKEMLQTMMENNGLGEKISEIKEKITNLRKND